MRGKLNTSGNPVKRIGLIAGSDELPLIFAAAARDRGESVIAVGVKHHTDERLSELAAGVHWVEQSELGRVPGILRSEGVRRVVLIGRIPQSLVLSQVNFDKTSQQVLQKAAHRQTDALLREVARVLEREGLELVDARPYLERYLAPKGPLTRIVATADQMRDVEFGSGIARRVGEMDIGQTVVVMRLAVLAVEAIEGTDAAIMRGGALAPGGGAVVVKVAKPNQDLRFDLPVIGSRTVDVLREARIAVLAVEAGKTVILERQNVSEKAEAAGIAIVGI